MLHQLDEQFGGSASQVATDHINRKIPGLPLEVIIRILEVSDLSTLCATARTCRVWHKISIPVLYRHLVINLNSPAIHINGVFAHRPPAPTLDINDSDLPDGNRHPLPVNPHVLRHTKTIQILPHHWARCCPPALFGSVTPPQLYFSNLRSVHFQVNTTSHHWPHGCTLLEAIMPPAKELIVSADVACDVLYWIFSAPSFDRLPRGIERLVVRGYREGNARFHRKRNLTGLLKSFPAHSSQGKDAPLRIPAGTSELHHIVVEYQPITARAQATTPLPDDEAACTLVSRNNGDLDGDVDADLQSELERIAILGLALRTATKITIRGLLDPHERLTQPEPDGVVVRKNCDRPVHARGEEDIRPRLNLLAAVRNYLWDRMRILVAELEVMGDYAAGVEIAEALERLQFLA